jgi:hypothetical protein
MYPNPAKESCTLELNTDHPFTGTIIVANIAGSIVRQLVENYSFQVGNNNVQLDLLELNSGIYLLMISAENGFLYYTTHNPIIFDVSFFFHLFLLIKKAARNPRAASIHYSIFIMLYQHYLIRC